MRKGAIILCGGRSSRMGRDKATLPFGPELLLQRVVRIVGEVVDSHATVVVAAANQELPNLPEGVDVVRDAAEFRGPLAGFATGLRALGDRADAVLVSGADAPLLMPAFAKLLFDSLGDRDAAVPYDADHVHALSAVYRPQIVGVIDDLLAAGQSSLHSLVSTVRASCVPVEAFRAVDPNLLSLRNVNSEQDYAETLAIAGFVRT